MNHKVLSGYDVGDVINKFSKLMIELTILKGIKEEDITVICMDKRLDYIQYEIFWDDK